MKKIVMLCIISILTFCNGCSKEEKTLEQETFGIGYTLNDGRIFYLAFEPPYTEDLYLGDAIFKEELSVNDFLNKLEKVEDLRDGGSKIYYYDQMKQEFGKENFYVLVCNSVDSIRDIYLSKKKESLYDKCSIKIDDLENVSMRIKEGTLTRTSATVIITDTSDRENIYGTPYKIEKYENETWIPLTPKQDMLFNSIGYMVGENHTLEFPINWESYYDELPNGKYRIIKDTSIAVEGTTHYITAEFTLE